MKRLLILSCLFISCGKQSVPHEIDPYFNDIFVRFNNDATAHNISTGDIGKITVVKFDTVNEHEYSECIYEHHKGFNYSNYYKTIKFNTIIKTFLPDHQYKIFLHEIGHCAYHLAHTGYNNSHDTDSIMFPSISPLFNESILSQFFDDARANQSDWYNQSNAT